MNGCLHNSATRCEEYFPVFVRPLFWLFEWPCHGRWFSGEHVVRCHVDLPPSQGKQPLPDRRAPYIGTGVYSKLLTVDVVKATLDKQRQYRCARSSVILCVKSLK